MIATVKPPRDSFRQRHHTAAFTVLEQFATGLIDTADRHGGTITPDQIRKALAILREQENLFDHAWSALESDLDAVKARSQAALRQDPFGRLLVSRFSHLLEGRDAGDTANGALSRDILQPFFKVIRMMVGMDMLQEIDAEIRAIVSQHANEDDELRDPTEYWENLAADPVVAGRINLVFSRMALHFSDYTKRKDWLISLVNDNLPHNDNDWEFTDEHCVRLLGALFRNVRDILARPEKAAELVGKLGSEQVDALRHVMAALDRDVAALPSRPTLELR